MLFLWQTPRFDSALSASPAPHSAFKHVSPDVSETSTKSSSSSIIRYSLYFLVVFIFSVIYLILSILATPRAGEVFSKAEIVYWPGGGGELEDEAKPTRRSAESELHK